MDLLHSILLCILLGTTVLGASRTTPPSGALIVRAGTTTPGEYATFAAALAALPNDDSSQSIFIYPGTYTGQVDITREGPLTIYGYTTDTSNYVNNQVNIDAAGNATTAGSDDASGTVRVHKNNFAAYNINIRNTLGPGVQAIALSQYGSQVGFYGCGMYGYQDTLYANEGTQVYLKGYIEGAVDFIFGRQGSAYFGGNTIAQKAPGCITASGRETNDTNSYVFNQNTIILASGAATNTANNFYLGPNIRLRVIFKNTVIESQINTALWSIWSSATPNTDFVFYADYNTTGPGAQGIVRPSFAKLLTAAQAEEYSIASAVGSNYASWVDAAYIV
ncbi:Pectinesterase [Mycena chlorophos]|uniref:Pectinesterase n=1 Tax=Mycena chlorophos TaxID=658473 RepID=A0A8H6WJF2_MYCCL|nr:Pectinesterase [Mycena chlorophos]